MQGNSNFHLTSDSKIKPFKLVTQPAREGKVFIGSQETNSYIIVDEKWKYVIKLISEHFTLAQIAHQLTQLHPREFPQDRALNQLKILCLYLAQNRLIEKIDRKVIFQIKRKRFRKLLLLSSKGWLKLFVIFFTFALLSLVALPHFFPSPADFFWSPYLSLCLLSAFLFTWLSAFLHEAAHLIIGNLYGIKGKMRLSHRLNFLVVESYFADICALSKKARIAVYISGTVVDLATISLLCVSIILLMAFPLAYSHLLILLLKQFVLIQWLSVLWQFFFFMKTDMYYVVKEFVEIENLYTLAKDKLLRLFHRHHSHHHLSARENRVVNIYLFFLVIGSLVGLYRYCFYRIPILLMLIINSVLKVVQGIAQADLLLFFDGLLVLIVEGVLNSLFVYTILKSYKNIRKQL